MREILKKYRLAMAMAAILMLCVLVIYLYKDSRNLTLIKGQMDLENYKLNLDIQKARVNEKKLQLEIIDKNKLIEELDKKIAQSIHQCRQLKEALNAIPDPLKNGPGKDPKEIKKKYLQLVKDFKFSQAYVTESESRLSLCLDKVKKLKGLIHSQELVYQECRTQVNLKDLKQAQTVKAVDRIDRYYKRRLLKKGTIKYTVGIIVGLLAGYFIFHHHGGNN